MSVRRILIVSVLLGGSVVAFLPEALASLGLGPDASVLPPRGRIERLPAARAIHYRSEGEGEPVVLVHGLPGFAADWRKLSPLLAAKNHRVIAYDRIGYGYSSLHDADAPRDSSFASNATDLRDFLDALGIEKTALVGWSYGGGIVQAFAVAYPERVSKIVLIASVGPTTPGDKEKDRLGIVGDMLTSKAGQRVVGWFARVPPLAWMLMRPAMADAFSGKDAIPRGFDKYAVAMIARPGAIQAYAAEVADHDFSMLAPAAITVPALVIQGSDDLLNPYGVAVNLAAQLPKATLVPLFEGTHMLPITHAAALAEEIGQFLAP